MLPKKARNNYGYLWLVLTCLALLCFFAPEPANAYNFQNPNLGIGTGTVCPGTGLTRRMVPCIKDVFLTATKNFLIPFSAFAASAVTAACTLAAILWGVRMLSGTESAPLKDGAVTAIKMSLVVLFTYNFGGSSFDPTKSHGGNFGMILDIMEQLVTAVAGYTIQASQFGLNGNCPNPADTDRLFLVWDAIDCAVETLIGGIFSPFTITAGIIGFLVACLFSNTIGFSIGMIGIFLIYKFVYAIVKCVYIYLSAYMGISFMVVISPLFIPAILFKSTKQYFDRWLKLFLSFIIQPLVVFAYLAMLLAAFDTVVYSGPNSLYNTIAGKDPCFATAVGKPCMSLNGTAGTGFSRRLGNWMIQNGFYATIDKGQEDVAINSKGIKNSGLLPENAEFGGSTGKVAEEMFKYTKSQQSGMLNTLNNNGTNVFEMSVPQQTVSWKKLAVANGYDDSTSAKSSTSYLLTVLVSAFMALLTGYVFVSMLEAIPMIGSGMANYGKPGDAISASLANRKELSSGGAGGGAGALAGKFGLGLG